VSSLRSKLVTAAAVGATAIGATAIASAATSGSSSSSTSTTPPTQQPPGPGHAAGSGQPPPSGQPPAQRDPSKGGHMANGKTETLLTGDMEAKVKAAALAKVSGTVERVETNVDSSAPYEAHIRKSDGSEVEVQIDSDFTVATVNTMGGHP
jgi:ABC-type transport system substrate-binding protein